MILQLTGRYKTRINTFLLAHGGKINFRNTDTRSGTEYRSDSVSSGIKSTIAPLSVKAFESFVVQKAMKK